MLNSDDQDLDEIIAIQRREENLLKLINETRCEIVQENGQRKLGGPPPNWEGPPPPKGCEIFVGKIPRDVCENELYRLFSTIGPIYELRLMMDFSGSNRGFAFIQFANRQDAARAIQQLNNYELRPRHSIGVVKSLDNCRLFIGGIPKDKSQEEIKAEMEKLTEGISKVIVYSSITDKTKNRGFAFVEYVNHRAASKARRKLIPDRVQLWGKEIAVDWAEPECEVEEDVMANVTVLYVRNLSLTTTESMLKDIFDKVSDGDVQKVKMMRDFAFVHFASRTRAQKVLETLNNKEINGTRVEITWAKPAKEKSSTTIKKAPSRKNSVVSNPPLSPKQPKLSTSLHGTPPKDDFFQFNNQATSHCLPLITYPSKSSPPPITPQANPFYSTMFTSNSNQMMTNLNRPPVPSSPMPNSFALINNRVQQQIFSIPPPPMQTIPPPFGLTAPQVPSPPPNNYMMDLNGNRKVGVLAEIQNPTRNIAPAFYSNCNIAIQPPMIFQDEKCRAFSQNIPPFPQNMNVPMRNLNCHESNRNMTTGQTNNTAPLKHMFFIPPFSSNAFH